MGHSLTITIINRIGGDVLRDLVNRQALLESIGRELYILAHQFSEALRKQVSIDPNFLDLDTSLNFKYLKKLDDIIMLIGITYYMDDTELRELVRLDLQERVLTKYGKDSVTLAVIMFSSHQFLLWLLETNRWHSRDFFGNVVRDFRKVLKTVHFNRKRTRVRKLVRKRGYRDHGSLRPSEKWLEKYDCSLTELQLMIEQERQIKADTAALIEGWLM